MTLFIRFVEFFFVTLFVNEHSYRYRPVQVLFIRSPFAPYSLTSFGEFFLATSKSDKFTYTTYDTDTPTASRVKAFRVSSLGQYRPDAFVMAACWRGEN